ncbi:hypothetical protein SAMN05444672_106124 [Bacillus sp. OK838]|nr:hypothetical protein SAMN05444672_106124 [Bacillus sp. OK838]
MMNFNNVNGSSDIKGADKYTAKNPEKGKRESHKAFTVNRIHRK